MGGLEGLEPPTSAFVARRSCPAELQSHDWRRAGALEAQAVSYSNGVRSRAGRLSDLLSS